LGATTEVVCVHISWKLDLDKSPMELVDGSK
jgi:hypothetical protein